MKKYAGKIDIEPTWKGLCNEVSKGFIKADILLPACEIADRVRQAQKQGKKNIVFTFEGNKVLVDEDLKSEVVELELKTY